MWISVRLVKMRIIQETKQCNGIYFQFIVEQRDSSDEGDVKVLFR